MAEDGEDVSRAAFWEPRYAEDPPWDAGGPAPPLTEVLLRPGLIEVPSRVAVPGCGRGHDAVRWAEAGHDVQGFDFAPSAVREASALAAARGVAARCRFELRDLFTLGEAYPAAFDVALEYTCFCAIEPARRPAYAATMAAILRPGGLLVALFYPDVADQPLDDGPPFPVRREHIEKAFLAPELPFTLLEERVPQSSIERRRGKERLVILRRA